MSELVLLINLGTPQDPHPKALRTYLSAFLMDPRVIRLPFIFRFILLYFFILPSRQHTSAEAYQKIWQEEGSPLLTYTKAIAESLQCLLSDDYHVTFAMRYGAPSMQEVLSGYQNVSFQRIHVFPLFPQYSEAVTGSIFHAIKKAMKKLKIDKKKAIFYRDFFQDPGFIHAYTLRIKEVLDNVDVDYLLFSYHGLPVNHPDSDQYSADCHVTTDLIAKSLSLKKSGHSTSFQSRLGRTKWIMPYTEQVILSLLKNGIKRLAVVCPSFVVDCLETLEEINMRLREAWETAGGETFVFIHCLNTSPVWLDMLQQKVLSQH